MSTSPFQPKKNNIPIIGQPFVIKSFVPMLQIVCNCEAKEPLLLIGNGAGQCPACHRGFQLQGMKADPSGQVQFIVGLVADQPELVGAKES